MEILAIIALLLMWIIPLSIVLIDSWFFGKTDTAGALVQGVSREKSS